jgi:CRP-like cAMP-binding protein
MSDGPQPPAALDLQNAVSITTAVGGEKATSPSKWGMLRKASFGLVEKGTASNIFNLVRRAQTVQHQCLAYLQLPPSKRGVTEVNTITSYVSNLKFFSKFPRYKVKELCRCVSYRRCEKGEVIFDTGEEEMFFYIIFSGTVQLLSGERHPETAAPTGGGINRPFFTLNHGDTFGGMKEENGRRELTAKTTKTTELLMIVKKDYMKLLYEESNKESEEHSKLLRNSKMFDLLKLSAEDLALVAKWMHIKRYPVNTVLARQGDPCFNFYCIKRGEVVSFKRPEVGGPQEDTIVIRRLSVMFKQPDAQMHSDGRRSSPPPPGKGESSDGGTLSVMRQAQEESKKRKMSITPSDDKVGSKAVEAEKRSDSPKESTPGRRSPSSSRSSKLQGDHDMPIFCVERLGRNGTFGELAAVAGDEKTVRKWPGWVVTSSPVEVLVISRSIIYRKLPSRLREILARYANDVPKRDADFESGVRKTKVWVKKKREVLLDADQVQAGRIPLKAELRDDAHHQTYHYHVNSSRWVVPSSDAVRSLLPASGTCGDSLQGRQLKLTSSSSAPATPDYSAFSCSTAATSAFLAQSGSNCFTSFPVTNAPHTGSASRAAAARRDQDLKNLRNARHARPGRTWKAGQGWVMDWGKPNPHRYRQEGEESDEEEGMAVMNSPLSKQRRGRRRRQRKREKQQQQQVQQQQAQQQSRKDKQQQQEEDFDSTATPQFKLLSLDAPCLAMAAKDRREKASKGAGGASIKGKSSSNDHSTRLLEMQSDHEAMGHVATSVPRPKGAMSLVSFGATYRPRPTARAFQAKNGSSRDSPEEQSGKLTMMHELYSHHQLEEAALLHTLTAGTVNDSPSLDESSGDAESRLGDDTTLGDSSPAGLTRKLSSHNMKKSMRASIKVLKEKKSGDSAGGRSAAKRSNLNLMPINTVSHFWAPPQIVRKDSVELVHTGSILTRQQLISKERRQRDLMQQQLTNSDGMSISLRLAKTAGDLRLAPVPLAR